MAWPKVMLREVLSAVERPQAPIPGTVYRQLGVKLWGVGAYERESMDGAATKYSTLSRVDADDVVVNKIWARNGSVAVVQGSLAGCYVSGEFPTFTANAEKLLPRWIHWLTKSPDFWSQCDEKSRGTSGKNRIKPEQFLSVEIPLPPLAEQRRIVARIEALAAKIADARSLRQQATEEVEAIVLSLLHRFFVAGSAKWKSISMDQAIEINDKQVDPTLPEHSQLPHISGENMESRTCRLLPWRTAEADGVKSNNYLFSPGTILYSKIRPYLRKAVFVDFRGVCSADVYPIRVRSSELDPHFVKWALVAEPFTNYANRLSGRTRMPKLNRKQLFGFELTCPSIHEQRQIVSELEGAQVKVDALKRLQSETAAELNALLPAILDRAFKGELS